MAIYKIYDPHIKNIEIIIEESKIGKLFSNLIIKSHERFFNSYMRTYKNEKLTTEEILSILDFIGKKINVNIENIKREFLKQI